MKLDKKAIERLSAMPDDALKNIICTLGATSGIDLSQVKFSPEEMVKLRQTLTCLTDEDIARAGEILSSQKKKDSQNG